MLAYPLLQIPCFRVIFENPIGFQGKCQLFRALTKHTNSSTQCCKVTGVGFNTLLHQLVEPTNMAARICSDCSPRSQQYSSKKYGRLLKCVCRVGVKDSQKGNGKLWRSPVFLPCAYMPVHLRGASEFDGFPWPSTLHALCDAVPTLQKS